MRCGASLSRHDCAGRIAADELHVALLAILLRKRQPRPHLGARLHARMPFVDRQLVADVVLHGIDFRAVRRLRELHQVSRPVRRRVEFLLRGGFFCRRSGVGVEAKQIRHGPTEIPRLAVDHARLQVARLAPRSTSACVASGTLLLDLREHVGVGQRKVVPDAAEDFELNGRVAGRRARTNRGSAV